MELRKDLGEEEHRRRGGEGYSERTIVFVLAQGTHEAGLCCNFGLFPKEAKLNMGWLEDMIVNFWKVVFIVTYPGREARHNWWGIWRLGTQGGVWSFQMLKGIRWNTCSRGVGKRENRGS